jgi:hypothetical protein
MTLSHYEERIKAWQRIKDWGVTDETNTLTYMLLEIDAKMGLDVEMPPFNWLDFFDADSMKHRVEMTQGWYGQLMVRWEKRIKEEEMSVRWMRHGNVLAKPAFADAYQESKPLTITGIKRAEKQAEKAIFSEALFEVLGEIFDSKSMEPRPEAPARYSFRSFESRTHSHGRNHNGQQPLRSTRRPGSIRVGSDNRR